jgi:phospholipid/cholesterol/gamma-HCH transport system permease protein
MMKQMQNKIKITIKITDMFQQIGEKTLYSFESLGKVSLFFYKILKYSFTSKLYFKEILEQLYKIGFLSLPVIGTTAIFIGGVMALQTFIGASRYSVESAVPSLVVLAITRELGPVITALMVAGRMSSAIAAELGTMRVTEQIDALKTLSVNPFKYLIVPRIIASTISLPILVGIADIIGIFGGYLTSVYALGFNSNSYLIKTIDFLQIEDVISGLIKSIIFGFIIAFMGCYYGYNSNNGAKGVGKAVTNAVVVPSITILLFNYLMTNLFFR